jgi:hypothetical protein
MTTVPPDDPKDSPLKRYVKQESAELGRALQKLAILGAKATATYSVKAYQAGKSELERRKEAARIEKERKAEVARLEGEAHVRRTFDSIVEGLREDAALVGADAMAKLEAYVAAVGDDLVGKGAVINSAEVKEVCARVGRRRQYAEDETAQARPDYEFTRTARDLLQELDSGAVSKRLRAIAGKYTMSNAGSVVGAVAGSLNRNGGAVAANIARSAEIGYHNGQAKKAFTSEIYDLRFTVSAGQLQAGHRMALRFCTRVSVLHPSFVNLTDSDQGMVRRCHFALVYANNRCITTTPSGAGKFGPNLPGEFQDAFRDHLKTIHDALSWLDALCKVNRHAAEVMNAESLSVFYRRCNDSFPTYAPPATP